MIDENAQKTTCCYQGIDIKHFFIFVFLKLHFHCFLFGRYGLKESLVGLESQHLGKKSIGEDMDFDIEVANIGIVKATGSFNFILGFSHFLLQGQEILIGLQIWIALGDGEQRLQGIG